MPKADVQVLEMRHWREERLAARDRVEAFLRAHDGLSDTIRQVPGRDAGTMERLSKADLWVLLGAQDSVLAAAGAVGHPLRDRLTEAVRRAQVDPQAIADTALRVIGRTIGGAR